MRLDGAGGPWVYILLCADGSFYVGLAREDLDRRISEHQNGSMPGYTSRRRPVRLVWSAEIPRLDDAIACETRIKKWSRAKKQALIRGDLDALRHLAKRRGGRPRE